MVAHGGSGPDRGNHRRRRRVGVRGEEIRDRVLSSVLRSEPAFFCACLAAFGIVGHVQGRSGPGVERLFVNRFDPRSALTTGAHANAIIPPPGKAD